jgi:hypothetical protein
MGAPEYATKAELHRVRDDVLRAIGVLGERIDSKLDAVTEGIGALSRKLDARRAVVEERLAIRALRQP